MIIDARNVPVSLHMTIVCGESISIKCTSVQSKIALRSKPATVISLAREREKRKCKHCDGIGIVARMIETEYGAMVEGRTCETCDGKGF